MAQKASAVISVMLAGIAVWSIILLYLNVYNQVEITFGRIVIRILLILIALSLSEYYMDKAE